MTGRFLIKLVALFASVIVVGLLIGFRFIGRLRTRRAVQSGELALEEIPNSDEGFGPAYRLKGAVPVRIATVASMEDVSDNALLSPGRREGQAMLVHANRTETWVIAVDDVSVPSKLSFEITRKRSFGGGGPDYGTLTVQLEKSFDKRFVVKVRAIEAKDLLQPPVLRAIEALFRAGNVDRLELDGSRTLRTSMPRRMTSGIGGAVAVANALATVATTLRGESAVIVSTSA
jgi:hypothetical protein